MYLGLSLLFQGGYTVLSGMVGVSEERGEMADGFAVFVVYVIGGYDGGR